MDTAALRNYATALYDEALEQDQVSAVLAALEVLASAVAETPELLRLAQHPGVGVDEKLALLLKPLPAEAPPLVGRFLALLLERHRFGELAQVVALLREVKDQREGLQSVVAESAADLTPEQVTRLENALARMLGGPVRVEARYVPDLLGGLRLHVNSEVLDESLTGRLQRLQEFLAQPQAAPAESAAS
jgi:F-type H+-transporting ATPase subunit delta